MLKIKDSVDLKKLEKFGFEEWEDCYMFNYSRYDISLFINKKNRKIMVQSGEFGECENGKSVEPKLYDLIKAGMVEKTNE